MEAILGRGVRFCESYLPSLAAERSVVSSEKDKQLTRHAGWYLDQCDSAGGFQKGVADAALFESSQQMVARRTDASYVKLIDTRRTMCPGFLMCAYSACSARPPHFVAPGSDQMSSESFGFVGNKGGGI